MPGLGKLPSSLQVPVSVKMATRAAQQRVTARALKLRRRNTAHRWNRADPVTGKYRKTHWCGQPLKFDNIELVRTENGNVMPSKLQFCGSVWACPVCGSIIRNARGKEIAQAVKNWQSQGGGIYLVTVTIRHSVNDNLSDMLDLMSDAWRRTVSSAVWAKFKQSIDLVGYTRTLEITYSQKNGWHPHYHFLYFVKSAADEQTAAYMRDKIYNRFTKCLARAGAKSQNIPNAAHGVDVRPVGNDGKVIGKYVSKICNIAAEVSASQAKRGRLPEHMDPFQLLDLRNERWAFDAWHDYMIGTKGKRSIYFSTGLRKLVGLDVEEKDDGQVVDDAIDGNHEVVGAMSFDVYQNIHSREIFDEYDRALTHAAKNQWQYAADDLDASLTCYVDSDTGEILPLLC